MAASYADSAQARDWDRRYDDWGRPKAPKVEDFHDYEAAEQKRTQRQALTAARELIDRKRGPRESRQQWSLTVNSGGSNERSGT
jgi:hypothetical protein